MSITSSQVTATSGSNDRVVLTDLRLADVEFCTAGDDLEIAWADGGQSGVQQITTAVRRLGGSSFPMGLC